VEPSARADAGLDGGPALHHPAGHAALDAASHAPDSPRAAGASDAGISANGDAGPASLDAGVAPDAGARADASLADAALADAALPFDAGSGTDAGDRAPPDAGETAKDGGAPHDAGQHVPHDAGSHPVPDAGPGCGFLGQAGGNSCPGVVACQENALTTTPVPACVLGHGSSATGKHCCVSALLNLADSCVAALCEPLTLEALCDGPEDCDGKACCLTAGATACGATCALPELQLCHRDQNCPTGYVCQAGDAMGLYTWWGFCRAK
jgi:hypothetical protein